MPEQSLILHSKCLKNVSLPEALEKCGNKYFTSAIGLFYSPISCAFGKVANTKIINYKGQDLSLGDVFEARIFNERAELRWLNEANGRGRAVLISEEAIDSEVGEALKPVLSIHQIDQQYLLWGEGTEGSAINGWSWLSAARIGKLAVPIPGVQNNERVRLQVCEYLSVSDRHGNVVVAEERLWGLQKIVRKPEET
jgi:CRISPR-associated protein (TIGR03984 family)